MRGFALLAGAALAIGSAQASQPGEQARMERENAEAATAAARNIAAETDPDGHAASCHVFLSLSINTGHARQVGSSRAAMERARTGFYNFLVRHLGRQSADQLVASSGNPLQPANATARDRASRYCVAHPMPARPRRR
jgi:hypothetical protein